MKCRKISQQKRTVLVSVVAGNGTRSSSEDVPADLWAWRKYGQKPIKGSPYPRCVLLIQPLQNLGHSI